MNVLIFTVIFSLISSVSAFGNENLLTNDSFEDWTAILPENWEKKVWDTRENYTIIHNEILNPYSGKKSLVIRNLQPNDTRMIQDVRIDSDSLYELSCQVKTENINPEKIGAYISVVGLNDITWDVRDANANWRKMVIYVRTGENFRQFTLSLGLGGFGSTNTGKAMFDDIMVKKVAAIPDKNAVIINMGNGVTKISKHNIIPHASFEVILMLVFLFTNTGLAVLYGIFKKKDRPILAATFTTPHKIPTALSKK